MGVTFKRILSSKRARIANNTYIDFVFELRICFWCQKAFPHAFK